VRLASTTEHALVLSLQAGLSLDAALTTACALKCHGDAPVFDFNEWLALAVQTGLVTGAHLLHPLDHALQHSP
jgi:hypothetical protein